MHPLSCTVCLAASVLALLWGCTTPSAATGPNDVLPSAEPSTHASAEPTIDASPSATAVAAPSPPSSPATGPAAIGKQLAEDWCRRGGTSFGPVGAKDAIASCDLIRVTVTETRTDPGLESAVIELRPDHGFSEEERYLYLKSGDVVGVYFLVRGYSSGVGGFSHEIRLDDLRVEDLYGDAGLEWTADVVYEQHDADMGECALTGLERRDLVLCSLEAGAFRCLRVPVVQNDYEERATRRSSGECGKPQTESKGFSNTARVKDRAVELESTPVSKLRNRFTQPTPPPFQGSVSIGRLFEKWPAKQVVVR